jgi:hypothetical protein
MKGTIPVTLLRSLWQEVTAYAKSLVPSMSFSEVFHEAALEYLEHPTQLPLRPNRRVTKYGMATSYKQQFPSIRTSFWIETLFLETVISKVQEVSKSQFGEESVDLRTCVETVLYTYCHTHKIPLDQSFFDDEYFYKTYTYSGREETLHAIQSLTLRLGRIPTAREWAKERQSVNGPSIKWIQIEFGSFSQAIQEAMVEKNSGNF